MATMYASSIPAVLLLSLRRPIPRIVLFHLSVSCLICYLMVLYTLFPDMEQTAINSSLPEF